MRMQENRPMRQYNNDVRVGINLSDLELMFDHLYGKVLAYVGNVATEGFAGRFGNVLRKRLADLATAVRGPPAPSLMSTESQDPKDPLERP
jgi:hypothetical protein